MIQPTARNRLQACPRLRQGALHQRTTRPIPTRCWSYHRSGPLLDEEIHDVQERACRGRRQTQWS